MNGLDYYEVLQISPNAEAETIQRVFRILAARYHPDNPETASLSILQLEKMMDIPREHLLFTIWFLKEKKCIEFTDNSDYVITGDGTEYIESHSPKQESLVKLLSAPQVHGKNSQAKAATLH